MRYVLSVFATVFLVNAVHAGNNSAGKASLSWDPDGVVFQLAEPPSGQFPLFLHLTDAPDIRSLAVELRWATGDSIGCYTVMSSAPDVACGWATDAPPGGDFEGDNTYTWSISFQPGSEKSCVVYVVSSAACGPTERATFWLASVFAKDVNGDVDSLAILDQATIGSSEPGDSPLPGEPLGPISAPAAVSTYVPSQVIVWFQPNVVSLPAGAQGNVHLDEATFSNAAIRPMLQQIGTTAIRMLTPTATKENLVASLAGLPSVQLDQGQLDMFVVSLADTHVAAALTALNSDTKNVRIAEPDWIKRPCLILGDNLFNRQWWLRNTGQYNGLIGKDLNAVAAWDRSTGGIPVGVVVLDTGIDPSHPDLAGRVVEGPNYITAGPPLDDDTEFSHGTSVSGMIGALGNGGGDVVGVDWTARIVAVKVCTGTGGCPTSAIDAAVDWARVNLYRVLNISLSGPDFMRTEEAIFRNAWAAGMAPFCSMGNYNCNCLDYPAGYAKLSVGVGAMMNTGDRWDDTQINWQAAVGASGPPDVTGDGNPDYLGSEWGDHIDFLAPGGRFIETTRSVATGSYWEIENSYYFGFGGTSAAAPAAAGAAALIYSLAPSLIGEDLEQILERTADPVANHPVGDPQVGAGSVNLDAAVAMVTGQNRVEYGSTSNVVDIGTVAGLQRTILDWPGIPPNLYAATKHIIRATVTFTTAFIDTPAVWPRVAYSWGAGDENPIAYAPTTGTSPPAWTPNVWLVSANQSQATFETYVYRLSAGGQQYWWPIGPPGAFFAYTAIGPVSVVGVSDAPGTNALALSVQPNPTREGATVQFSLPSAATAKLAVYDLSGRVVRELASGSFATGRHRSRWDLKDAKGREVRAGLYFVRLRSALGERTVRVAVAR